MNKVRPKLSIINRSLWPNEFVKPVCRWIVNDAGITWDYEIILRGGYVWHGSGGKRRQHSTIPRHLRRVGGVKFGLLWPWSHKDSRFKWAPIHTLNNRLEAFVYLVAHEACHANVGHPNRFIENGRCNADSMEFRCNAEAMTAVERFRKVWPTLKPKVVAAIRENRQRKARLKTRRATAKSDPTPKLAKAQSALARWLRKQKAAANKVKKYQRKVRYYEGRIAACSA